MRVSAFKIPSMKLNRIRLHRYAKQFSIISFPTRGRLYFAFHLFLVKFVPMEMVPGMYIVLQRFRFKL